jgi:NADPH-dependent 2,4-dienoyl-CoA reductase/sulfur reductase-like enzyme
MTAVPAHVLVVGASASGLSTVEALRRHGFTGRITVLGDELHPPYDRPPLSKQVLSGEWHSDRSTLRTSEVIAGLDADLVLGETATALDSVNRSVTTAAGRTITADAIVIATGVRARRLPGTEHLAGVHVLRTLDDALALRQDLQTSSRLVVVGEGVLGSEIAATSRILGADVTLTGPLDAPMALQVGPLVSGMLADLHRSRGVDLRLGAGVSHLTGTDGRIDAVHLTSGESIAADVAVVAIGAIPATDWLSDSGLEIDNGVVCDAFCRAADGIYAVGDVARWHHEHLDQLVRLENRTNATEQAAAVASVILGDEKPYVPVPYFWSDQFDVKIQVHGVVPAGAEPEVVEGDLAGGRFVTRYSLDGSVTGVVGWNMPKQSRQRRQDVVDALASTTTR